MNETIGISAGERPALQDEFTTPEAAEFLRCSEGYLVKLRGTGEGPAFHRRFKRRGIFYLRDDLEVWRLGTRYLSTTEY